jgi:hypothetical protein
MIRACGFGCAGSLLASSLVVAGCGAESPELAEQRLAAVTVQDWTWTPLAAARCRNGTSTGIGFRRHPSSKKLLIFVDGGGACHSSTTCALNPNSYGLQDFQKEVAGSSGQEGQLTQGVFDLTVPWLNPVDDFNQVFIPYCTGDLHGGRAPNTPMPWPYGTQQFVGYDNMEVFLSFVLDEFAAELAAPNAEVVFAGESAGGWGVLFNTPRLAQSLPSGVRLTAVSDASPFFSAPLLDSCLQKHWRKLWKFDSTFLPGCGSACSQDDWVPDLHRHVMSSNSGVRYAFLSSNHDTTANLALGTDIGATQYYSGCNLDYLDESQFEAGLLGIQARMQSAPAQTATFLIDDSTEHQWLAWDRFYTEWQGLVPMISWFDDVVDGTAYTHVGL